MNEEYQRQEKGPQDQDAAGRMVNEASRRYKDTPTTNELTGITLGKLFEGRIDKENYIYGMIAIFVLCAVLWVIPILGWLVSLALGLLGFPVLARRFHDINQPGWYGLSWFIPVGGLLVALYLATLDAVDSGNRYGPKPDPKRRLYHAVLNI